MEYSSKRILLPRAVKKTRYYVSDIRKHSIGNTSASMRSRSSQLSTSLAMIWNKLSLDVSYITQTACSRLAVNDVNKKILVDLGILKHLVRLCDIGEDEEKEEALDALWALAFLDANKEKMVREEKLVDILDHLRGSANDKVKKQSINTLWTLKDKLQSSTNTKFKELGDELSASVAQISTSHHPTLTSGKHIMISYNWNSQDIVFKVHERLMKAGYQIWIDKEKMKGSIIECIANGLENADVMLMCISQKYKKSKFCRGEAEYAFTKDIPIIPILVESDYKADGWLGFIKGANQHFNFTAEERFDTTFEALVKEIGQKGKCSTGSIFPDEPDTTVEFTHNNAAGNGSGSLDSVINWSATATREWLKNNSCYRTSMQDVTGKGLIFLKDLQKEAPEFFYHYLKEELKLKDVNSLASFVSALRRL